MKCNLKKLGYKISELNLSRDGFHLALCNDIILLKYDSDTNKIWIGITRTDFVKDEAIEGITRLVSYVEDYKDFEVFENFSGYYIKNLKNGQVKPFFYDLTPNKELMSELVKLAKEHATKVIEVRSKDEKTKKD